MATVEDHPLSVELENPLVEGLEHRRFIRRRS